MDNSLSYEDLKKAFELLGPRPPNAEVWVRDYIPSKQVFKIVLKDLPTQIYTYYPYLPGTEEIYMMSAEDFSMVMAEKLRGAGVPVFGPDGERLG